MKEGKERYGIIKIMCSLEVGFPGVWKRAFLPAY